MQVSPEHCSISSVSVNPSETKPVIIGSLWDQNPPGDLRGSVPEIRKESLEEFSSIAGSDCFGVSLIQHPSDQISSIAELRGTCNALGVDLLIASGLKGSEERLPVNVPRSFLVVGRESFERMAVVYRKGIDGPEMSVSFCKRATIDSLIKDDRSISG
jgi:hypothetical protein